MQLEGESATELEKIPATQISTCKNLCANVDNCNYFAFDSDKETCTLLSSFDSVKESDTVVSGAISCEGESVFKKQKDLVHHMFFHWSRC